MTQMTQMPSGGKICENQWFKNNLFNLRNLWSQNKNKTFKTYKTFSSSDVFVTKTMFYLF